MLGDRNWMYNHLRNGYVTNKFNEGVERFLQLAFLQPNNVEGNKIRCPYSKYRKLKVLDQRGNYFASLL